MTPQEETPDFSRGSDPPGPYKGKREAETRPKVRAVTVVKNVQDCLDPCPDGCMWCCPRCNYDRHICHGCGDNIGHSDKACRACREADRITGRSILR